MCRCKVCGKSFRYGDKNSPMLNQEIWDNIVDFYNLRDYETEAYIRYSKQNFGFKKKFKDKDEYHLYLCTDCMEKALGRKLTRKDLIGENVPLNQEFEEWYF